MQKAISVIVLIVFMTSALLPALKIQPVRARSSIYIRADGSIDPLGYPISSIDNVTYDFTGDIPGHYDIIVQRSNIIVDGNGYSLDISQRGFDMSGVGNVTITNVHVLVNGAGGAFYLLDSAYDTIVENTITQTFLSCEGLVVYLSSNNNILNNTLTGGVGIHLISSSNNHISRNIALHNSVGIWLEQSHGNIISENNATTAGGEGIMLISSGGNIISANNLTYNGLEGLYINSGSNNMIFENLIENNLYSGVGISYVSSGNRVFHNVFKNNSPQARDTVVGYVNYWDDGYPSGGNYWNDYSGPDLYNGPYQNITGSDGIGDKAYPIQGGVASDRYPFTEPWEWLDIVVINVQSTKSGCVPLPTVCPGMPVDIYVTVKNKGNYIESFNVTAYVNATILERQNTTLQPDQNTTLTFTWNTTGLAEYKNYTISAAAGQGTNVDDSTMSDSPVTITHMGDVTGDGLVDIQDVARVSGAYASLRVNDQHDPQYGKYRHPTPCRTCPHEPNTDVTGDGKVDIQDLARTSANFGWHR